MTATEVEVPAAHSGRQTLNSLLPIVGFAFLLRLVFVLLTFASLPASEHFADFGAEMGWTARSLAAGQGFSSPFFPQTGPTALVPPLYPLLLAGIFRIFGVYTHAAAFIALAANSVFSSLTAAVIFLGMRRRFGVGTAKAAAWTWALYPYAIYYSAVYLWDCALTSFLFSCCFFLAIDQLPKMSAGKWAAYGALCGVAALANPSTLTILPLLMGFAAWRRARLGSRWMLRMALALLALVTTLAPWMVRNAVVMHTAPTLRDGFWGEFYAGNNGDTSHSNPDWTHPASNAADMERYQRLGEIGYMDYKRGLSLDYVTTHPDAFIVTSIRRVVRYWTGYWSFSRHYLADQGLDLPNVPFCCLLTALMLSGAWRLFKRRRLDALPYLATLVIFPLPYYVTHASADYRQPIEPIIVTTVTYAAVYLVQRVRRRAGASLPSAWNEAS